MPLSPQVLRMQCHPSVLFFSTPLLVKLHHSICSHRHQVLKCKDEDCEGFLPWLEKKAGFEISSVLSIGKFIDGRSLFASKRIQTGDYMLKVPFDVQLSPDNILPEIKALLDDEVGIITRLAIVILTEQKKGQDSEWAPYISHLPNPGEIHTTLFWNASELEMVKQSSVYQEAVHQQAQVRNDYFAVKPVLDRFPQIFEDVKFEEFCHACALVGSRAWGSTKGLSLIPFADFLNHDGASESVVLSDEAKCVSEVIADRDYVPGEEVFIRYGKFPNSTLLVDFGFTVPYNIYDQVAMLRCCPRKRPPFRVASRRGKAAYAYPPRPCLCGSLVWH